MYNFNERLTKLISIDKIRVCKLIEVIQYCFICLVLILLLSKILHYYFTLFSPENKVNEDKQKYSTLYLFWLCFKDTVIIIIFIFYLRKILLLFPSLASLLVPSFKENTTLDLSMHIALVFIFLEFVPEYKRKINALKRRIY